MHTRDGGLPNAVTCDSAPAVAKNRSHRLERRNLRKAMASVIKENIDFNFSIWIYI